MKSGRLRTRGSLPTLTQQSCLCGDVCRYLRRKAQCERELGDACEMGGYTRICVRDGNGNTDDLVDEIPTFVAEPLNKTVVDYTGYDLVNRPYGLLQWAQSTSVPEEYVLIEESDHVLLGILPNMMPEDGKIASGSFSYMQPALVRLI